MMPTKPLLGLRFLSVGVLGLCAGVMPLSSRAVPGETQLVTVTLAGLPTSRDGMERLSVSADGRYITFQSQDPTLVPGDSNGFQDVFVRDVLTGMTELISVGAAGEQANHDSSHPSISADGRYVAFSSVAGNLIVPGRRSIHFNIFVRDRVLGATRMLAVDAAGTAPDDSSDHPIISGDGRFVAFRSWATNWIAGSNGGGLFVTDLATNVTQRVSPNSGGDLSLAGISADGSYVAFTSGDSDLVPNDTNGSLDAFVFDRSSGSTEMVSVNSAGAQATGSSTSGSISADGRYVSFASTARNLGPAPASGEYYQPRLYLHDRLTGITELVSRDGSGVVLRGAIGGSSVSLDGRYVAFDYFRLGGPSWQGALRDRTLKKTSWLSVSTSGELGDDNSIIGGLTPDARFVVFSSAATNFAAGDIENTANGFIREIAPAGFRFTVKPYALDFGQRTLLTTSQPKVLWIKNWGTAPLPIIEIRRTGEDATMFKVSHNCGSMLDAGKSCAINVRFAPTSVGPKTAQVRVLAGDFSVRKKLLAGTGTQ